MKIPLLKAVPKSRLEKFFHALQEGSEIPSHCIPALFNFCPTNDRPGTNQTGGCLVLLWKIMK
jgi:hypothetical protein